MGKQQNVGKRFESAFRKSVPDDVYCMRIRDEAQSFRKSALFSHNNPFDFLLFYSAHLFCFELKSTKGSSCSFERTADEHAMIHYHQIIGLRNTEQYDGIISGFLINWRNDELNTQATYFIRIQDFDHMIKNLNKKSFNVVDMIKFGAIKVDSEKLRVNYKYDIKKLLEDLIGLQGENKNG